MRTQGRMAVTAGVVLWSLGNLAVRWSSLPGSQLAFWRYVMAATLYSIVHVAIIGPLRFTDFRKAAPAGIAIAVEIAFFFMAIKLTTVANTTVIGSLVPLLLFAVASRRFGETIPRPVIISTFVGLIGVALVVFGSANEASWSLRGDGLAVLALIMFAAYFTFAKSAREAMSAFTLQTHSLLVGVPVLAAVTVLETGEIALPQGTQWWHPVILVALPSTGHLLVNWAHNHVTLTFTSLMTLIVPPLSVIGAWFLFDEQLTITQIVGIVLAGSVLVFAVNQTAAMQTSDALPDHDEQTVAT